MLCGVGAMAADQAGDYNFTASMDSGKAVCNLLKAVQISEYCAVCATEAGLKVTLEEGRCVQASAYVPADNFAEFHVTTQADVLFKVSLVVLTECLNMFGAGEDCSLRMYYKGEGAPLMLVLQPHSLHNVVTDCELRTLAVDSLLELRDENAPEVAKLVLKAPLFHGLLADLERSCDVLELHFSSHPPNLSIVTHGMQYRSCFELQASSDMMLSFSCARDVTLKYQLAHVRLIMKALAVSSKVVMICDASGVLLVQLKLEKDDHKQMFSEFFILPLLDD